MIILLSILLAPAIVWGWTATIWYIVDFFNDEH
jgi:hypothetical protein